MPPQPSSSLAFLLSLASLPIVGCGDDGVPVDDTGGSMGDDATTSTSSPDAGDDDMTAGASTGSTSANDGSTTGADTSAGPMDGSTTGDASGTSTGPGDGTESGSTATEDTGSDTGAPVGLCEMFGEHLAKCVGGRSIFYTMYCETTLGIPEYPDDCIAAWEDYFACIVATSCEDLEMEDFCADEIEARELACPG